MAGWSDAELRATVDSYLQMLAHQTAGRRYSKTAYRNRLLDGPLAQRNAPSIEFRMRNISAVQERHGRDVLSGYLPARNVGEAVAARLWRLLQERSSLAAKAAGSSGRGSLPNIIYFNIGWMERYAGSAADDPTLGAHGYLSNHKHGAEAFNFVPTVGMLRGYRPGHQKGLRTERLGGTRAAESVSDVLVVWMAREPQTRQTMIVGWYDHATVFRTSRDAGRILNGETVLHSVEASPDHARLLPVVARNFRVQSSRTSPGGFGQSPVWYGSEAINAQVWAYIQSVDAAAERASVRKKGRAGRPPRNQDPELRRKVERAAVDHAEAFYRSIEGGGCLVESVEPLGRGWDLEVDDGETLWLVEVKGLSGSQIFCELTPNEYKQMNAAEYRERYIVYVVSNALTPSPIASIFSRRGASGWSTADGRALGVLERVGAVLTAD